LATPPEFYIDENAGTRSVRRRLEQLGYIVHTPARLYGSREAAAGAPDTDWLPRVGRKGWAITLQKYPYVLDKIADAALGGKRYAVIIDEAHSSQGGDAAARLKQALGVNAAAPEDDEDPAEYMTRVRGQQPNLSYFAFTATPKSPTLKLFGTWDPDKVNPRTAEPGMYVPFHVYSMRQAIEEGYILDVLANYITYETKWRLRNAAVDHAESSTANPEVDERKAKAKLVRFAELHPTSLEQKAKLVVDDFRDNIAGRLGGRAKAMVVTTGRQHALDLYQAIRKYVDLRGFTDCGALVAFSGSLKDDKTSLEFTEAQLNGFPERQLPDRFGYVKADDLQAAARNQDEYRLLVAADKYQTGFDQPLLCAMYVDKPLTGVAAVQTLSRFTRSSRRTTCTSWISPTRPRTSRRRSSPGSRRRSPNRATRTCCTPKNARSWTTGCWWPRRWRRSSACWPRRVRGGCRTRPSGRCTPSCTGTCSPLSTASTPWRPTTSAKGSAARCGTMCAPTASSRRSSPGATGTSSASTSTAGCC
jgi:SWI2/SNF2 ATPase